MMMNVSTILQRLSIQNKRSTLHYVTFLPVLHWVRHSISPKIHFIHPKQCHTSKIEKMEDWRIELQTSCMLSTRSTN